MRAGSSAATPETAWSRSFSPKWPDPNQLRRDPAITAARTLRDRLADIAARGEITTSELSSRFGLHWGATLYIGRILTRGRSEVTALGEEVNETARIEACATSGRTLASKSLIERLDRADAEALGVDTRHTTYTPLADLATATDKARRDAPAIAVCEV
jgi:class 3 adenylate cyclase